MMENVDCIVVGFFLRQIGDISMWEWGKEGGGGVRGSLYRMSIIRHGNVALSILRKSHVALSILRKSRVTLSILRISPVAYRYGLKRAASACQFWGSTPIRRRRGRGDGHLSS